MDDKSLEDAVQYLLRPLDLKFVDYMKIALDSLEAFLEFKDGYTNVLIDEKGRLVVAETTDKDVYFSHAYLGPKDFLKRLFKETTRFLPYHVATQHTIAIEDVGTANPYFGCESLEEAMIRADLLDGRSRQKEKVDEHET